MSTFSEKVEGLTNPLIFLNSAISLMAQFVIAIQERFSEEGHPFLFSTDENKTKLFVHTTYDCPDEIANATPRIVIGRGTYAYSTEVLGHLDSAQGALLNKDVKFNWSPATCDFTIECVSPNRGEAELLGDLVQAFIWMTRESLCENMTLRDIPAVMLQPVRPWPRIEDRWMTQVQFRVILERRWVTAPAALPLTKMKVQTRYQKEAAEYIQTFILPSED